MIRRRLRRRRVVKLIKKNTALETFHGSEYLDCGGIFWLSNQLQDFINSPISNRFELLFKLEVEDASYGTSLTLS